MKSSPPPIKPTLSTAIIDRGNISIVEISGKLVNNKHVISECLKKLEIILSQTIVIDVNGVDEIDDFGSGTLAVMSGWISLNEKDAFLSCDDSAVKDRITSLGITHLVPEYPDALDSFKIAP